MNETFEMGGKVYNTDSTMIASRWQMLKAKLLGEKHVDKAGPYVIVAYYYKGKWYIDKYERFSA